MASGEVKKSKAPPRKPKAVSETSPTEYDPVWVEKQLRYERELREGAQLKSEQVLDLAERLGIESQALEKLLPLLEERTYSPDRKPEEPVARYSVGNISICTPGNLTTISAQAKAGKTAAVGALMASAFCAPGADCLGFASQNPEGFALVHFDTEQSKFDHWQGIQRCAKRAKVSAVPRWLRSVCLTSLSPLEIRQCIRIVLQKAADEFGGIHSVFIDGIADAVLDVNDPKEATTLVAELQELAIKFDCSIVVVIHVNPNGEKTRGHLGSHLERKSETNLKLQRDEDEDLTIIWADKNRRAPISKKSGPCFAWKDDLGMHVSVENPSEANAAAKAEAKASEAALDAQTVFAHGKKQSYGHGELCELIGSTFNIKPKVGGRRRLETWLEEGIVTKDASGFYALTV